MPTDATTTAEATLANQAAQTKTEAKPTDKQKETVAKAGADWNARMFRKPKAEKKEEKADDKAGDKTDDKKDDKKEPTTAEAKVADDKSSDKKEVKDGDRKEEKKEPKKALKPVVKEKPPQPDLKELVKSTIESTVKAVKAESKTEKDDDFSDLSKDRRKEVEAIQIAEKKSESHKGSTSQALERFRAEKRYIESWESKHPGEKFDPESDEHDDWYAKNIPPWMEDSVEKGQELSRRDSLRKDLRKEFEEELLNPLKQKLSSYELREQEREVAQKSQGVFAQNLASVIHAINPDLLKEGVKVEDVDPQAHEILMRMGPDIAKETQAAMLLMSTRGASLKEGDPLRDKIIKAANEMEKTISEMDDDKKVAPDGKTFVPLDEWAALTESEQGKHWTITGELVSMKLASERAEEAKKLYAEDNMRIEKLAKAKGWVVDPKAKSAQANGEHKEEEPDEEDIKTRSPSTSAQTVIQPGADVKAKVTTTGRDRLVSGLFRRP